MDYSAIRRFAEWADVARLERAVESSLRQISADLAPRFIPALLPAQNDRLRPWRHYTVEVTDATERVTTYLPESASDGDHIAVTFVAGQGVCWIADPSRGGEILAAVHDAGHTAVLVWAGGAWRAITGGLGWNDVIGGVRNGTGAASLATAAYRETSFMMYQFASDQNENLSFAYQMPHGWARTPVRPHVHVIPTASATGVVLWRMYYTWSLAGSGREVPVGQDWTMVEWEQPLTPADQYTELATSPGLITPPDWADASAHLIVLWQRRAGTVSDTYNQVLPLLSFDVHVQITHFGSYVEFPT